MSLKKSRTGCLVCLNSFDNLLIPAEESQNIFNICCSYVKQAINIHSLIKHLSKNNNKLSFCKNCMEYVLNLTQAAEQLEKLKTEITDLTNSFSESISKRRRRAVTTKNKTHFSKSQSYTTERVNTRIANRNVAEVASQEQLFPPNNSLGNNEEENSNSNLIDGASNLLKLEHQPNEFGDIENVVVKTENGDFFPEEPECLIANLMVEESESNCNLNDDVSYNVEDSLPEKHFEIEHGFVRNDDIILSKEKGTKLKQMSSFKSSNIGYQRFRMKLNDHSFGDQRSRCRSGMQRIHNTSNTQSVENDLVVEEGMSNYSSDSKVCNYCKLRFQTRGILKRHMKIHTGEKPFTCSICAKSFRESFTLKRHVMMHMGERPHKCSQCEKSFILPSQLRIHEKVHSQ